MAASIFLLGVLTVALRSVPTAASAIPVECADRTGRLYDGIGGLSNSCAPWLRSYPIQQQNDILDVLFTPGVVGALQVVKIEIGGDGHSTINTEASYWPRGPPSAPDFTLGWELWFAAEAKKRNPNIRVVGLPWSFPHWYPGLQDPAGVAYYVEWVKGAKAQYNVTIDYIGIKNEAGVPAPDDVVALRTGLDAAGLQHTLVVSPDTHDFGIAGQLTNRSAPIFNAIGVIGIHEPLRTTTTLPEAFQASGKPIWSSEAYTTYSDSNGGGCWARALNWGYVYGNVTAHIAWNILQSYPSVGDGMNYNGHGLMWAESPWSGHYTINSPIWVSAHYTWFTEPGWRYLSVGKGSGELPEGGTFVSLVDPESGHVTMIMQTMEYNLSQCFKDTHSPFSVAKQTASFQLTGLPSSVTTLQVRRTVLIAASPIDPIDPYTDLNSYFLKLDAITLGPGGTFTLELPINTVTTVTSLPSTADPIVPAIPPATAFTNFTSTLQGVSAGRGTPYLIDQQGVFVAAPSRLDASVTTLQQTIPAEPQEWHGSTKFTVPHTFVGPSALTANISVEVLPASGSQSFGAIGFNGQIGTKNEDTLLRVDENGKWHLLNNSGIATSASGWIRLALQVAGNGDYAAFVGQAQVATGSFGTPQGWFPTLAASYSGAGPNVEFRNLAIEIVQTPTNGTAPPPAPGPPAPPSPAPPPGSGARLVTCNAADKRQSWIFSGEDGGEPGTFSVSSNLSACLDAMGIILPAQTVDCSAPSNKADLQFTYTSLTGAIKSVEKRKCQVASHGTMCNYCLDAEHDGAQVGFFDCKPGDSNQVWIFDATAGGDTLKWKEGQKCVGYF